MLITDKIDILVHIFNNPHTSSNQLNFFLMTKYKSKKTTSSIYRYVRELVSDGYLTKTGSRFKKLAISRKGRLLLDSLSRTPIKDRKKNQVINVIIITQPTCYLNCNSQFNLHLKCRYNGGSFY